MSKKANTTKKVDTKPTNESQPKVEKTPSKSSKVEKTPSKSSKVEKTPSKSSKVEKTPSKSSKVDKTPSKVEKTVEKTVEKSVEPDLSDVEENGVEDDSPKKRHIPTKESIIECFDELVDVIDEEIKRLRESSGKCKGVKFLRSLAKKIKTVRGYSVRVMKQKQKSNRKNNTNSGFLKPVHISNDMAKFTGWNQDELKSRVDVTKYICKYIRDNNLQNPDDRRQIVADKKLSKLLDFNSEKDDKPLTYYRIQTYMKKHFTNPVKVDE